MLFLNLLVTTELKNWTSFDSKELNFNKIQQLNKDMKELNLNKEILSSGKESTTNNIPTSIEQLLNLSLLKLEKSFGTKILAKICTYLAYTKYGLREVELIGKFI